MNEKPEDKFYNAEKAVPVRRLKASDMTVKSYGYTSHCAVGWWVSFNGLQLDEDWSIESLLRLRFNEAYEQGEPLAVELTNQTCPDEFAGNAHDTVTLHNDCLKSHSERAQFVNTALENLGLIGREKTA